MVIINNDNSRESICEEYKVSESTLKNIIQEFSSGESCKHTKLEKHASKIIQSKHIQGYIKEYIENNTDPFWLDDVIKYIKQKWDVVVQKHQLRKFIRDKMKLSYKKGGSRPSKLNLPLQSLLKWLFWIRLTKKLKNGMVIINIDESVINRNTRINYSWLEKGKSWAVTNTKFINSISLISAIWTNGFSMSAVLNWTIASLSFVKFLEQLKLELKLKWNVSFEEWIIILDNSSIHRSKLTRDFLNKSNAKVHYLVPYSPELAPI